ncbi:hypothetical protein BBJ28_00005008 [Nothophytophthora sp. Chile5]|nr:hypothetical protein BBJ28_00005008 [Nothophytophthora sp. Chile5]
MLRAGRHALLGSAAAMTAGGRSLPRLRVSGRVIGQSSLSTSSKSPSPDSSAIMQLLEQVASGEVSPQAAAEFCGPKLEYESVGGFAKIDTSRGARTGFPEVVYAESKTPQQVAAIMKVMINGGESNVMASRVDAKMAGEIRALLPDHHLTYYEVPRILASKAVGAVQGNGGVAEPAASDERKHVLQASDVAICVAGMDGALPGVVVRAIPSVGSEFIFNLIGSDEASASGTESHGKEEEEEEEQPKEEMRWIAQSDLDKWKQRMAFQVEDYFASTYEQLKRIAEFGRVHASLLQEAKQYVYSVEMQLRAQLEQERAALRVQAEEFVAKVATENEALRQQVVGLEQQIVGLNKQVDVLQSEKTQHGRQEPDSPQEDENEPQQQPKGQFVCEPEVNQDMGEDGPTPQQAAELEGQHEHQQPMDHQSVCEAEANEEMNEDGENCPINIDDGHEENQDAEPGARGSSTRSSSPSQQTSGHILKGKTPIPMLHAVSSPQKDPQPQPQQSAHSNSDGAMSSTSQESARSLESSEPPAGDGD